MLEAMAVELIIGPPNSGRSVEIRRRIEQMLEREPVLVVPTGDDAAQFERDLCAGSGSVLGVAIRTFASLFDEVARAAGLDLPPLLSPPQRLALIRAAIDATPLRQLRRSSARPGFAPALDALLGELQAALVAPAELELAARELEDGEYERELAALFESYERLRESAGRSDRGSRAAGDDRSAARAPGALGRTAGARLRVRRSDPRAARADRGARGHRRGGDRGQLRRP